MENLKQLGIIPVDYALLGSLFSGYRSPRNKIANLEIEGKLIRLKRGLYVVSPNESGKLLSTELIANHLYGPSYVSMESALSLPIGFLFPFPFYLPHPNTPTPQHSNTPSPFLSLTQSPHHPITQSLPLSLSPFLPFSPSLFLSLCSSWLLPKACHRQPSIRSALSFASFAINQAYNKIHNFIYFYSYFPFRYLIHEPQVKQIK